MPRDMVSSMPFSIGEINSRDDAALNIIDKLEFLNPFALTLIRRRFDAQPAMSVLTASTALLDLLTFPFCFAQNRFTGATAVLPTLAST